MEEMYADQKANFIYLWTLDWKYIVKFYKYIYKNALDKTNNLTCFDDSLVTIFPGIGSCEKIILRSTCKHAHLQQTELIYSERTAHNK